MAVQMTELLVLVLWVYRSEFYDFPNPIGNRNRRPDGGMFEVTEPSLLGEFW
jgi:hypothetical protein